MKGDLAAKDAALRQQAGIHSCAERDKKKTESELQSQNTRLNRALDEVVKFRKLLEESKVRGCLWPQGTESAWQENTSDFCNAFCFEA